MKIKKVCMITVFCFVINQTTHAQNVAINEIGATGHSSAILDVSSTSKGVLFPRVTTIQRNSITTPAVGLIIYNLDIGCYQYFDGNGWLDLCGQQKEKLLFIPWAPIFFSSSRFPVQNVFSDKYVLAINYSSPPNQAYITIVLENENIQTRQLILEWPGAEDVTSVVVIDSSLYVLVVKDVSPPFFYRLYHYNVYNINLGGTQVTLSGLPLDSLPINNMAMTYDGLGNFYFNFDAGNSMNDYRVAKYTLTTPALLTYQTSINFGSSSGSCARLLVNNLGDVFGLNVNSSIFTKFDSLGVYQYQTPPYSLSSAPMLFNWSNSFYGTQGNANRVGYEVFWLK
jgi:hypothetical protein